jgi:lipopolysaccharide export system permease protein
VAVALAASLAVSRMVRESELTAIRSTGVSLFRVIRPILFFGVLLAFLNFYIADHLAPSYERKAHSLRAKYAVDREELDTKTNAIIMLKDFIGAFGVMHRKAPDELAFDDVLLMSRQKQGELLFITANKGYYRQGQWAFITPYSRLVRNHEVLKTWQQQDLVLHEKVEIEELFNPPLAEEQTTAELAQAIQQGKSQKRDITNLEMAYYDKFSTPAACVVFALSAPILAVWFARMGAFMGVLLSIFLVLAYYNTQVIITEIIGRNGWLSPLAASWFTNALFAVLGILAIRRTE